MKAPKHLAVLLTAAAAVMAVISCGRTGSPDSQRQPELKFDTEGRFRIAQFTDLHWNPRAANCDTTEATIRAVVAAAQPDFAILTGDVVTDDPAIEGWNDIVRIFEDLKLPFTVEMGNHDAEHMTKDSIYDIVTASPLYVGDRGPKDIFGYGNCALPVTASDRSGKTAAVIYTLDSNDYQPRVELGHYDWIHFDQIAWYRDQAARFAEANGGRPVPSLAFFHICLPEYAEIVNDAKTYGTRHEGAGAPAALNSGLFASMAETGDVMGIFTGHDHDNDYIGMLRGVALAFGRVSGAEAYGDLKRGARIIDLYEGERKFDTYIVTPEGREPAWYYPSAINQAEEESAAYLPAATSQPETENGVDFVYYEGPDIKGTVDSIVYKGTEVLRGATSNFDIGGARVDDHFAFKFRSLLRVPRRGIYRFYTYSDDGSVLRIDGNTIVDNDGGHSARRREGSAALEAGLHLVEVDYLENYMGQVLEVGFSSRDIPETVIPDSLLFRPGK